MNVNLNRTILAAAGVVCLAVLGSVSLLRPGTPPAPGSSQGEGLGSVLGTRTPGSGSELPGNVLSTTGTSMLDVRPDTAIVTLGFQKQAKSAQEAQAQANEAMSAVLNAIKEKGIPEEKIRTSGYNLTAEYDYKDNRPVLVGYRVNSNVTTTITKLDLVGPVIDAAIEAGANQVLNVAFTVVDTQAHQQAAIDKALEDAQEKAKRSAAKLGVRVAGVRRITIGDAPTPQVTNEGGYRVPAGANVKAAMPVQPGEVQLRTTVNVEFLIGP